MRKSRSIVFLSLLATAVCLVTMLGLGTAASATPYFLIGSQSEWQEALLPTGEIKAMTTGEWDDYMYQWGMHLVEGDPYPTNTFLPPELYVWGGGGGGGLDPEDPGLVMVWGDETTPDGSYSSAWKYVYLLDPDLTGSTINITVTAPQINPFPPPGSQINAVSFGIQDNNLPIPNVRSWQWSCGAAPGPGVIQWNTPTTITINPTILSVNAATPVAAGFANNPAFNLVNSTNFIVDENASWVGGAVGVTPPGQVLSRPWNYWTNLSVTPPIPAKFPDPLKWSQPPVEVQPPQQPPMFLGWNEKSMYDMPPICADDWECTDDRPVTDIHWWGSFIGWTQPDPPPLPTAFQIGIWTDVPDPDGQGPLFSHPGQMIYEHYCDNYTWNFAGYDEDPRGEQFNEACFQFHQYLVDDWFYQDPGPTGRNVYWLSIAAIYDTTPTYPWGWKTREHFFNDDAVRIQQVFDQGGTSGWPPAKWYTWGQGEPIMYQGESWDLAFELTTNQELDWGDAPDPNYPTLLASDGARHKIIPGFCLGLLIDGEPNGLQDPNALGDDNNNLDDEDGAVSATPFVVGQPAQVVIKATIPLSMNGKLDAWVDYNGNGSWADSEDQVFTGVALTNGDNTLSFVVPNTAVPGWTFARLRLSSAGGLSFQGLAQDGEVEDYLIYIEAAPTVGTLTVKQNLTIYNHFWWPGDPDLYNEMISLLGVADAVENISWDTIALQAWGTGNDAFDISSVDVWLDSNNNGVVDDGGAPLGSGVYGTDNGALTFALAPAPIVPAGLTVPLVISYTMNPAAPVGSTYRFDVTGATGTGQTSGSSVTVNLTPNPIPSATKTVGPDPISIGQAKKLPIGTQFLLNDKITTANFQAQMGLFYIEEEDRSSGIGIDVGTTSYPVSIWDRVAVLGTCALMNGTELVVVPQYAAITPGMPPLLGSPRFPVGMNNKWTGGGLFGGQPAVYDNAGPLGSSSSVGLSNVGMLITTWGEVTYHEGSFPWRPFPLPPFNPPIPFSNMFWINDGTYNLMDGFQKADGTPTVGVGCWVWLPSAVPNVGEYWGVTGILRAIPSPIGWPGFAEPVRLLVPRTSADLVRYNP